MEIKEPDLKALGLRISKLRESKGINASKMSLLLGKSRAYMCLVEAGKVNISLKALYDICQILGVQPKDIL